MNTAEATRNAAAWEPRQFVLLCKEGCKCEIINSKPLYLADKLSEIPKVDYMRLLFTTESYKECKNIIQLYKEAISGNDVPTPFAQNEFTRGHMYRGVL